MGSTGPPAKSTSRWGNLLQQAVAGVESRLDTILAEGDDGESKPAASTDGKGEQASSKAQSSRAEGISRQASKSKANDRLQEKLARARARRENNLNEDSPGSSALPSRAASPSLAGNSPRISVEIRPGKAESILDEGQPNGHEVVIKTSGAAAKQESREEPVEPATTLLGSLARSESSARQSLDATRSSVPSRTSTEAASLGDSDVIALNGSNPSSKSPEEYESLITQIQADHESSELRRQEEIHSYIERIDALQSKLQYLAKEAAATARQAAGAAASGSLEQKLAEKEEQIALLMEEGQKLSKTELKHMTTIKQLRARSNDHEKAASDARHRQSIAEKAAQDARERLKRAESAEKRANEKVKSIARLEKELLGLRAERDTSNALVTTLRNQLSHSRASEAEKKAHSDAIEAQKKVATELRDDLTSLKIEKELSEERARAEIREWKEKLEREHERARMMDVERKGEQAMMESKMEVLRARAEEVSAGATSDAQVKLLRQIETLQTQYAVASENWQGIEGSLISRVTSLEKERDELLKKEGDIRRKARELNLKSKRLEDQLDSSNSNCGTLERDLRERREETVKLQEKVERFEQALADAQADFNREKQNWESTLAQKLEQERLKGREEASSHPYSRSRTGSPTAFTHRANTSSDVLTLQTRRLRPSPADIPSASIERSTSYRTLREPSRTPDFETRLRQDSLPSFSMHGGGIPDTPSIHTMEPDDMFDNDSSPHRTINDMISGSTAAAGPSVQLVERMSAAVRRLESEKASTREEVARLSTQRDEARREVASLMREVDEKRAADARIAKLESEMAEVTERYQTTLEMLGEKSELVEELRADVADVKKIYRELVESTVK